MVDAQSQPRDLTSFVLSETGCLEKTGNPYEPYRLLGPAGAVWFSEPQAQGKPAVTVQSYGMALPAGQPEPVRLSPTAITVHAQFDLAGV